MALNIQYVQQQIKAGIQAHKTGDNLTARLHLQKALREDPENITALLWVAYITPDFDKQIFLLQRVLQIDPDNQRAKQGLAWVKEREKKAEKANRDAENAAIEETAETKIKSIKELKQKIGTSELKEQAKKGPIVQRARRRIGPLVVFIISGLFLLSLLTIGLVVIQNSISLAALQPSATPTATIEIPTATATATLFPTLTPTASPTLGPPTATPTLVVPSPTPVPPTPTLEPSSLAYQPTFPGEKWIEVNITDQTITAWEGNRPIMAFNVSTGLPNTPTVLGQFRIYQKLTATRMTGPGYDLPNVPHTMYFHQGYGLHGAYWHDNFGQPMSHGCVNLSLADAETLFNWAEPNIPPGDWYTWATEDNPGTVVVVHQ